MATRQIKDAKDLSTNELIYFKGHAQATYMSDGRTVEEVVNSMSGGSSDANVQAIVREAYQEPEARPLRDAVDLATGEKIYFAGDANYICVNGNSMLLDYIDDKVATVRIIKYDVEPGTVVPMQDDLLNWVYADEGILILNGGLAIRIYNEDPEYITIQSAVIKDDNIFVTKMYSTMLGYPSDLVTIDSYPISGGGSGSSGITSVKINGVSKTPSNGVVDLGYVSKQLSTSTSSSMTLSPNIYYRNTSTSLSSLTITLGSVSNSNILNEYFVEFTSRSSGTTVSLPSSIKWANGVTPTFENGKTYQISIVNNLGTCVKFG